MTGTSPGPLSGFRVVDLTNVVSGPSATQILADQGADVIKVENPSGGDFTRLADNRRAGFSASFLNNNRNKRSIAVDLKAPEGLAIVTKLIESADVVAQNFRPGVIDRMGLGYDAVRAINPRVVYLSISGFGPDGPYADKPVYDPLVQALSGLTTIQGGSDTDRPRLVRTILPDKLTGITAAQAVTAALLSRERTGEGQHVELSMLGAVVAFLWNSDMGSQTFVGNEFPQAEAQSFIDLIYETKDGYVSVSVMTDKQWAGLSRALERPDLLEDPRFKTTALRQRNINDRLALTQDAISAWSTEECLSRLEAEDVPCVPVLRRSDMIRHPQVAANGIVVEYDHPVAGRLRQARPAARFSETPAWVRHGAPVLGADTAAVLAEIGYDAEAIEALRASRVVGDGEHVGDPA